MKIAICSVLVFGLTVLGAKAEASELTYADLVKRLYDMKILATPSAPGEKSGCFSSWDRGARYDEGQGKYVDWHANGDGGGFMDRQGTMMKMDGPGVIWRIWSAMPQQGHLKVFVDGGETPALDRPTMVRHQLPDDVPFQRSFEATVEQYEWEGGCEDLHIVENEDGVYVMNYTTWRATGSGRKDTISIATSQALPASVRVSQALLGQPISRY